MLELSLKYAQSGNYIQCTQSDIGYKVSVKLDLLQNNAISQKREGVNYIVT